MKYVILSLLVITVFFESCNKESSSAPNISGNWNWFATYIDNKLDSTNPRTPQNIGITELVSFSGNNFTIQKNNQIIASGTYSTNVITNSDGKPANCIHYKSGTTDSLTYYVISNDTLTFSYDLDGSVGSGSDNYKRVK